LRKRTLPSANKTYPGKTLKELNSMEEKVLRKKEARGSIFDDNLINEALLIH
jgi:hypothetical protein